MPDPIPYDLMPKQYQFVHDTTSWELLYSGAFGAGKTRALCVRAMNRARFPGSRVGLTRKTSVDLKASTLITLLEPDGELPPVLPVGSYHHHKTECRIYLHGGGEITYFGCDDPSRVASRYLTDICIDEGIELDREEYDMLLGRMRGTYLKPDKTKSTPSLALATNPGSPTHFLYDLFYKQMDPGRRVIETSTAENTYLPKKYIDSMSDLTGSARDRFFLGKWVAYEGAIYSMFSTAIHVLEVEQAWDYLVAGVDWGFVNPAVIRLHGCLRKTGRSHVMHEYYRSGVISGEFVQACVDVQQRFGRIVWVVDPSAVDIIQQMKRRGLSVVPPPIKSVEAGIRLVQTALDPTTGPMLTMSPKCVNGNREYQAYRWKPNANKEEPVKELDHALDADRYARTYITSRTGGSELTPKPARRVRSRREMLRS